MERRIAANRRKTWLLLLGLLVIIGGIASLAGFYFKSYPLGLGLGLVALAYAWFAYYRSSKLVIRLAKAKPADKIVHRQLYRLVENLSLRVGITMPRVYVIDDPAINALAAGNKPEKSLIAVTSGALEHLDKNELEGVLAHEMSHIINRDVRVGTLAFALVVAIVFLLDIVLRFVIYGGDRRRDARTLLIALAVAIVLYIISLLGAMMIQASISRKREYMADTTGAQLTRYPEGLASALEKIANHGGGRLQKTSSAAAHLFFANPLKPGFFTKVFSTHPPLEDRIRILRGLQDEGY